MGNAGNVGKALAPGMLLTSLLYAHPALAQDFDSAGGGVFVGYGFGEGADTVTWGFEGFVSWEVEQEICANEPRVVYGPIARLSLHGVSRPAFTLAAHGGRELKRGALGFSAEAGATLGFPGGLEDDAVLSPHSGFAAEGVIFNLFARQEWLLDVYSVGGGVRIYPTFGAASFCAIGRPQRDADGRRLGVDEALCSNASLDARAAMAHDFRRQAREEYESVPAFIQLARELCAARAPLGLRQAALRAARDELRHTSLCATAAGAYGKPHLPNVPRVVRRPTLEGKALIERLALESWLDGCLGEGLAARLAKDDARTQPPMAAAAQSTIARDEQRHAELGWEVLAWALEREPSVRHALEAHRDVPLIAGRTLSGNAQRRQRIADMHRARARERLATLL